MAGRITAGLAVHQSQIHGISLEPVSSLLTSTLEVTGSIDHTLVMRCSDGVQITASQISLAKNVFSYIDSITLNLGIILLLLFGLLATSTSNPNAHNGNQDKEDHKGLQRVGCRSCRSGCSGLGGLIGSNRFLVKFLRDPASSATSDQQQRKQRTGSHLSRVRRGYLSLRFRPPSRAHRSSRS